MKSKTCKFQLTLMSVVLLLCAMSQAQWQKRSYNTGSTYTPVYQPAQQSQTQAHTATQPQYHPAPQAQTQSRPATQSQTQSRSATQPQYHPAPQSQTQSRPATQSQNASHPATQPQYHPAPQSHSAGTQPGSQAAPRSQTSAKEQERNRKQQEKAQKEIAKQKEKEQKQQARLAKEQQAKQKKEQAQQRKETEKRNKEQKKAEERQRKESAKQQKNNFGTRPNPPATNVEGPKPAKSIGAKGFTGALSPAQSHSTIEHLNSFRSSLSGINRQALPQGDLTVRSNGTMTLKASGNRQLTLRPNGTVASYKDATRAMSFNQNGKLTFLHTAQLDVFKSNGQRTIVDRRMDGTKIVSTGPHSGYVERMNDGASIQRTTIVNNRVANTTLVNYSRGRLILAGFVPSVYFAPTFYGWAYYPWAAPAAFTWGWDGAPWYVGPNPYFVAASYYPSAAFWLTDYAIGSTLEAGYELREDNEGVFEDDLTGNYSPADDTSMASTDDPDLGQPETVRADITTPITSELKEAVVEEVKQRLAEDSAESDKSAPGSPDTLSPALRSAGRVFIVSNDLDVTTANQQICQLQAGDMLQVRTPVTDDSPLLNLQVASSKRGDCPTGIEVSVSVADLQDMHNSFEQNVENGLGMLREKQGHDGLPAGPADVMAPPRPATDAAPVPNPLVLIQEARTQADAAEQAASNSSF